MLLSLFSAGSLLVLGIGLFTALNVIRAWIDPLRDIPGPFLARFTRLWYVLAIWKGDFERTNIALHQRYGSIVRISPNEYSINDPEAAKIIYGPGTGFIKGRFYTAFSPMGCDENAGLFSKIDPHQHSQLKRKFASSYSMSSIVTYEAFVDNCTSVFIEKLGGLAASDKAFDLECWLQCYAMDVIGEITFGSRFGFLDKGVDENGVFDAIQNRLLYTSLVGNLPWLHTWLEPLMPTKGSYSFIQAFAGKLLGSKSKLLQESKGKEEEGLVDQSTKFLRMHNQDPEKFTRKEVFQMALSNVFAGSDTTGITLSAIFYHLMKNPDSYHKLQQEIDTATEDGRLSAVISFSDSQQLKYLQAVIKEALRLHPAVGLPLQRIVPKGGATIAGRHFPPGVTVGINPWVAHHNKSVFGPDADSWRPERWLEFEEQGRTSEVERYNMPFGLGSRTCIGKNISLLEMGKLVPRLIREFDFALDSRLKGKEVTTSNRWFVKQQDLEAIVSLRK